MGDAAVANEPDGNADMLEDAVVAGLDNGSDEFSRRAGSNPAFGFISGAAAEFQFFQYGSFVNRVKDLNGYVDDIHKGNYTLAFSNQLSAVSSEQRLILVHLE